MALALIPEEHIPTAFTKLQGKAETEPLKELCRYVSATWIGSTVWPPSAWCVFMQRTRTNNDLEGWHHRLNNLAKRGNLQFYLLLDLLHKEGVFVNVQVRLVSENKLSRHQSKKYTQQQQRIFSLWDKLNNGEKRLKNTHKALSHLNGPHVDSL